REEEAASRLVERGGNRAAAAAEVGEAAVEEPRRTGRPRIHRGPQQRGRERRMRFEPEMRARTCGRAKLLSGPGRPPARIVAHGLVRERCEERRIRRMHGDELALKVGRQLGNLYPGLAQAAGDLVAVRLAFG